MRNLRVRKHRSSQPPDPVPREFEICEGCAALTDVEGRTFMFYVSHAADDNKFYLHHRIAGFYHATTPSADSFVPWNKLDVSSVLAHGSFSPGNPDSCVGLAVLNSGESLLIAMQNGAVISVCIETGELTVEGEFVDEDTELSGILALGSSPDGAVISVISPKKITVLSIYWDIIAEIPLLHTASAASICWREDGEYFVVAAKSANIVEEEDIHSYVISRDCENITKVDLPAAGKGTEEKYAGLKSSNYTHVLTWQPRVGGFISIAGLDNTNTGSNNNTKGCATVSFFERNGLRHLRSDFAIEDSKRILCMKWSCDSEKLAIIHRLDTSDDRAHFAVDVYVRKNYKWECKKRLSFSKHPPKAVVWDEDDPNIVHLLEKDHTLSCLQFQPASSNHSITTTSRNVSSNNNSNVAVVVDGKQLRVTNLSQAVIPPPMCHGAVQLDATVDEVCSREDEGALGALLSDARFCRLSYISQKKDEEYGRMLLQSPVVCKPCRIGKDVISTKYWDLEPNIRSGKVETEYDTNYPRHFYRSPVLLANGRLLVVRTTCTAKEESNRDEICLFKLEQQADNHNNNAATLNLTIPVEGSVVSITCAPCTDDVFVVSDEGFLQRMNIGGQEGGQVSGVWKNQVKHASFVDTFKTHVYISSKGKNKTVSHAFVLSRSGHLILVDLGEGSSCLVVSKECTSFEILAQFLVFTTRSHVLYCIPLEHNHSNLSSKPKQSNTEETKSLFSFLPNFNDSSNDGGNKPSLLPDSYGAIRPIDRGSVIIASLANDVRLILQAPRGNLETIAPRPVVVNQVRQLVKAEKYGQAFILCRQQRIDMNEIVDLNFDNFIKNIAKFADLVENPDHLSVFLSHLQGDEKKINTICEAMIAALTDRPEKWILPLLTAYVRKTPREYENALLTLWNNHCTNPSKSSGLIDYLFVLCKDDNILYNVALGTYNLSLAILVAKCSKILDPAEYGIEVKKLHAIKSENERKFTIDRKLGRYISALKYLHAFEHEATEDKEEMETNIINGDTGHTTQKTKEEVFAKSIKFVLQHALFPTALELFKHDEGILKTIRDSYSKYLMRDVKEDEEEGNNKNNNNYSKAATMFVQNKDWYNAARAYDLAGNWQLAVGAIGRCDFAHDDEGQREEFYRCVKQRLQERGNARDAAYVSKKYLQDIDDAVDILLTAECWESAVEMIVVEENNAEHEARVVDAIKEGGISLVKEIEECASSVREKGKRLEIVRETKRLMQERLESGRSSSGAVEGANSDIISGTSVSSFASNISDLTFVGRKASTSVYSTTTTGSAAGGSGEVRDRRKEKAEKRRLYKSKKKRIKQGHPHEEQYLVQYLGKRIVSESQAARIVSMKNALAFYDFQTVIHKLVDASNQLADESLKVSDQVFEDRNKLEVLIDKLRQSLHCED